MSVPGGLSETTPVTDEVTGLANTVKKSLEEKTGKTFATYEPVTYRSQVVAGTNYYVKVKVGDGDYVHIKVFRPLPDQGDVELTSFQEGKKEDDDIESF